MEHLICPIEHGSSETLALLVEAGLALASNAPWPERWAEALRAVEPLLRWSRAALLGRHTWQLHKGGRPVPLPPWDPARERARDCSRLTLLAPASRTASGAALAAPVADDVTLYLEFSGPPPAVVESAFLAHFIRLLSRHLPAAAPESTERSSFHGILGRSAAMQALFERMALLAPADVSVHVTGETGTGKERVAKALHGGSTRRDRRFVAINASSISDELFEAEMFGHARGAFTGAIAAREGHVAEAAGGTLFIDEVTDLSPRAQAKLLRLLQEREYRRVGETTVRRADIRVITASNAPLEQQVAAGAFRRDLLYRLNVVVLALPPLRERDEDVVLLARHFLSAAAARTGAAIPPLPSRLARELLRHDWPGNVRELENEMNRLLVLAGRGPLRAEYLSFAGERQVEEAGGLREARQRFERDYVVRALSRNGGHRTRTALDLRMTRQALLNKIKRLGI